MTYRGKWPGTWATICDVCGFRFPSDKLKKRWDGLMTCESDWETRHPQDFIRVREEKIAPDWVRPVVPDEFVLSCTLVTSSGIADFGTADCARADTDTRPPHY